MKNSDLVGKISRKKKLKKEQISTIFDVFVEKIRQNLTENRDVEFLNVGILAKNFKEQKIIVNPKTKKKVLYPPKNVLELRVSKQIREYLKTVER